MAARKIADKTAGKQTSKPSVGNGGPVVWDGDRFARGLAQIAARTVYAAIVKDPAMLEQMEANGKDTAAFERLTKVPVPEAVRAWVAEHFEVDGVVHEAIASEIRIAFERFTVAHAVHGGVPVLDIQVVFPPGRVPGGGGMHPSDNPPSGCMPLCNP